MDEQLIRRVQTNMRIVHYLLFPFVLNMDMTIKVYDKETGAEVGSLTTVGNPGDGLFSRPQLCRLTGTQELETLTWKAFIRDKQVDNQTFVGDKVTLKVYTESG
jgi:hypothetical protein